MVRVVHVIIVSAQVVLVLTLGLWTLDFGLWTSDLGLTIVKLQPKSCCCCRNLSVGVQHKILKSNSLLVTSEVLPCLCLTYLNSILISTLLLNSCLASVSLWLFLRTILQGAIDTVDRQISSIYKHLDSSKTSTRRSILGSDGMTKSEYSLSLWFLSECSLSILWLPFECLLSALNALWMVA